MHKDASGPKICQQLQAPSKTPKERTAHRADRPESGDNSASIAQNVLLYDSTPILPFLLLGRYLGRPSSYPTSDHVHSA